jgi:GNAT superfamily N-acetyltransferase
VTDPDASALREVYDAQLRAHIPDPLPEGTTVEYEGPLVRMTGLDPGGFLTYRDLGGLADAELDALNPTALTIVVAETDEAAGGEVVSAGWIRYIAGTSFTTLWGGSTLPQWRRRGIYRALVTYRARLAEVRGFTLLEVDASDDSRPILQRLGLVPVTTTTPYVFTPPPSL